MAALLGVTRDKVYAMTRDGVIPHIKLGPYYRYRVEAIEKWLERVEHKPE